MKLDDLKNKLYLIETRETEARLHLETIESSASQALINADEAQLEKVTAENSAKIIAAEQNLITLSNAKEAIAREIEKQEEAIASANAEHHMELRKQAALDCSNQLLKIEKKIKEAGELIADVIKDDSLISVNVHSQQFRRVLGYLCVAHIMEPANVNLPEMHSFKGLKDVKPVTYPLNEILGKITKY